MVSNKPSKQTERLIYDLVGGYDHPFTVIERLIRMGRLGRRLRELRTGQYTRIEKAFNALVAGEIDLWRCTVQDLEAIHGIGPKTARFFLLKTRPGVRCAALDTHILKWLKARGHSVPKATPQSGKRYAEIEKIFLEECDKAGKAPAELDSEIWRSYAEPKEGNQT